MRSPSKSSVTTPADGADPPIERFMTCKFPCPGARGPADEPSGEVGDIRLAEVGPLLRDYRRLAALVEALKEHSSTT